MTKYYPRQFRSQLHYLENLDFLEINECPFVDDAPRAASILKNRIFVDLINVLEVAKHLYLRGLEHRECLRRLSFEKCCRMH